ncbi:WD domain, G-beta repeat [Plasmodiophora brassicae]
MTSSGVFAHAAGPGALAWHPQGRFVFTGGIDAVVKGFAVETMSESVQMEDGMDPVAAIAFQRDGHRFACAAGHGVNVFEFGSGFTEPTFSFCATRLIGDVKSVAFDASSTWLAVAGDEVDIKLVNLEQRSEVRLLSGHKCPVKFVTFDESGELLASAGVDGRVFIWNVSDRADFKEHDSFVMAKTAFDSDEAMSLDWCGQKLAAPARTDAVIMERVGGKWKTTVKLTGGHTDHVSIVRWSRCGRYIATAGMDRKIAVWNAFTGSLITTKETVDLCAGIGWCPTDTHVAYLTTMGNLCLWKDLVSEGPVENLAEKQRAVPVDGKRDKSRVREDDDGDDEDLRSGNDTSMEETSPEKDNDRKRPRLWKRDGRAERDGEDDEHDGEPGDDMADDESEVFDHYPSNRLHRPFQPGATAPDGSDPFLMAWTLFGSIESSPVDGSLRRVQINFADVDSRPRIRVSDRFGFTLGSLGKHSALFASAAREGRPSTVFYRSIDAWASNSDWSMTVPSGEDVLSLCLAGRAAVIVTDRHIVRVLSFSGIHRVMFSLSRPVVATAGSDTTQLAIISGYRDDLEYAVYDLSKELRQVSVGRCPLTPGTTLKWVGFSEDDVLLTMDSAYYVRALVRHSTTWYSWTPVLDGRAHIASSRSTSIWPVGATSTELMVGLLKGGQDRPVASCRPILVPLAFHFSLLVGESDTSALEQAAFRTGMLISARCARSDTSSRPADQQALRKLYAQKDALLIDMIRRACKSENPSRALDLATRLHLPKSRKVALAIVEHLNQTALANRMRLLIDSKPNNKEAAPAEKPAVPESQASPRKASPGTTTPPKSRQSSPPVIPIEFSPSPATRPAQPRHTPAVQPIRSTALAEISHDVTPFGRRTRTTQLADLNAAPASTGLSSQLIQQRAEGGADRNPAHNSVFGFLKRSK